MIYVLPKWTKPEDLPTGSYVDTTSSSGQWNELSPFILGPVASIEGVSKTFENLWQYSKVYTCHVDTDGNPLQCFFHWRQQGFDNPRAVRYPMGKGAIPLYSWWDHKKLDYVTARKKIYVPIYAKYVAGTSSFRKLEILYNGDTPGTIDEWLHSAEGREYLNDELRKHNIAGAKYHNRGDIEVDDIDDIVLVED